MILWGYDLTTHNNIGYSKAEVFQRNSFSLWNFMMERRLINCPIHRTYDNEPVIHRGRATPTEANILSTTARE